jgi:hypothetical protein
MNSLETVTCLLSIPEKKGDCEIVTLDRNIFKSVSWFVVLLLGCLIQMRTLNSADIASDIFLIEGSIKSRSPITSGGVVLQSSESVFALEVDYSFFSPEWLIRQQITGRFAKIHNGDVMTQEFLPDRTSYRFFRLSLLQAGYPVDLDWDQRLVWLLYCGRDYLHKNDGKPIPQPRGDVRRDFEVATTIGKCEWAQTNDVSPQQLKFIYNPQLLDNATAMMSFEPQGDYLNERRRAFTAFKSLPPNTLLAQLSVLEWTNAGSFRLPLHWRFVTYDLGNQRINREYEGVLRSISRIEQISRVDLSGTIKVSDLRLRDINLEVNEGGYSITDGNIPSVSRARLLAGLTGRTASGHKLMPPNDGSKRTFWILTLGIILSTPIFILFRGWLRDQQHQR